MRVRINVRVAKIEQLRIEKKLGKVIRLLGDEEYILCWEDGMTCTTPAGVANILDKFVGKRFQVPNSGERLIIRARKEKKGTNYNDKAGQVL
jgi:predicted RNA-binding Zn-ribbon protein involved in translation (DUF1610 family)